MAHQWMGDWGRDHELFRVLVQQAGTEGADHCALGIHILPGVTRDSILHLARGWNEFQVSEKNYKITELIEAL